MSNIEIIDRRGARKPDPVPVKPEAPQKGKSGWRDVGYFIQLMPADGGVLIPIGRAAGVRVDGIGPFVADYILPSVWGPDFNWQKEAKKRLDTFIDCGCRTGARCALHGILLEQWQTEDVRRVQTANASAMPEAIEMLMRAEIAARANKTNPQPQIIVPR